MKFLIIEDEMLAAKRLRELVQSLRPGYQYITRFDSVEGAVISLPALRYDVLFMDIQLADGLSFDIFDQISIKAPIIFTTAYDEFALRAFKANSVDYLLKPIDPEELARSLDKLEANFGNRQTAQWEDQLTDLMKSMRPKGKERFVVKVGDHLKAVESADIQLFYSQDKATYLLTRDGRKFPIDYTLDKVEELMDKDQFFRISRKFMINLSSINDMVAYTNSRLELKVAHYGGEQIIVARERVGDFRQWLDR